MERAFSAIVFLVLSWSLAAASGQYAASEEALANNQPRAALDLLNGLPSATREEAAWHGLASQAWEAAGDPARAVAECEAALAREPHRESWHLQLGRIFLRYHTPMAALEVFDNATLLFPSSVLIRLGRGLAESDIGLKDKAEADFRACLRQDPPLALAFDGLATLYLQSSRFPELAEASRRFRQTNPGDYRSYYFEAASVFAETPEDPQSEALTRDAIRRNPRFAAAHALLGKILLKTGRASDALEALREAVRLRPDYSPAYLYLSKAYRELGRKSDMEAALAGFRKAKEIENAPAPSLSYHRGASRPY